MKKASKKFWGHKIHVLFQTRKIQQTFSSSSFLSISVFLISSFPISFAGQTKSGISVIAGIHSPDYEMKQINEHYNNFFPNKCGKIRLIIQYPTNSHDRIYKKNDCISIIQKATNHYLALHKCCFTPRVQCQQTKGDARISKLSRTH